MPANQQDTRSRRVEWIDFAKGLGILLVILAHTAVSGPRASLIRGVMFSFHMPLFLILSSMTFRCSESSEDFARKTRRAAKHLLLPCLIVFTLFLFFPFFYDRALWNSDDYWVRELYALIMGSGVGQNLFGIDVPAMGVPWFFFALFFSRTLFDYLHLKVSKTTLTLWCWVVSALGVVLGRGQYLPLSLDVALAIVPFCWFGWMLRDRDIWSRPVRLMLVCLVAWLATLWLQYPNVNEWTYLELACRRYPMYPLCFFTAAAGSLFICALSILATRLGRITAPIVYLGRNSLYLLCVHCIDGFWYKWWGVPGRQFVECATRILADILVFLLFMLLRAGFRKLRERRAARA